MQSHKIQLKMKFLSNILFLLFCLCLVKANNVISNERKISSDENEVMENWPTQSSSVHGRFRKTVFKN